MKANPSRRFSLSVLIQTIALLGAFAFLAIAVRASIYGVETWPWPRNRRELIRPTGLSEATAQNRRYVYTNLANSTLMVIVFLVLRRRT